MWGRTGGVETDGERDFLLSFMVPTGVSVCGSWTNLTDTEKQKGSSSQVQNEGREWEGTPTPGRLPTSISSLLKPPKWRQSPHISYLALCFHGSNLLTGLHPYGCRNKPSWIWDPAIFWLGIWQIGEIFVYIFFCKLISGRIEDHRVQTEIPVDEGLIS